MPPVTLTRWFRPTGLLLLLIALAGCEPQDRRPGLWLSGDVGGFPADVAFTDAHQEIAIEIRAPYGLPHSVTIWCARVGDQLYVAAANPESKRWPDWADARPEVRLKIGDRLFEAQLVRLDDAAEIAAVQQAYVAKYDLDPSRSGPQLSRYWRVEPPADSAVSGLL